jgi:hypothetical protein
VAEKFRADSLSDLLADVDINILILEVVRPHEKRI